MPGRSTFAGLLLALAAGGAGCVTGGGGARPDAPDHPLLVRAEQAYLEGDCDRALAAYRGYRAGFGPSPFCADASYFEGVILLEKGDPASAEAAFRACIAAPRTRFLEAQAWIGLGDCHFVRDRYGDAIAAYQRALDLRVPDARTDYALYRLAAARQRYGEWSGGRTCYEMLIRDHPRSVLAARARQRLAYADHSFHLQVGAFHDEENARNLSGYVLSKGIPAKVVRGGADEGPWLVWAGAYQSYEAAKGAVPEIQAICGKEVTLVP